MLRSQEQRRVIKGIFTAAVLTLIAIGIIVSGRGVPIMSDHVDGQLSLWAATSLLTAIPLLYCIGRLAKHRFFSPEDIIGSGFSDGTPKAKLLQAMLQNTLEQTLLASLSYAGWCFLAPASWGAAPAVAVILFLVGRFAFFAGYERGAAARSFGFALTFYPSAAIIVVVAVVAARELVSTWLSP